MGISTAKKTAATVLQFTICIVGVSDIPKNFCAMKHSLVIVWGRERLLRISKTELFERGGFC